MENAVLKQNEVLYLPVDSIKPNPYQPRKFFERANLEELAKSIREYGVIQPISVRLINGYSYELVAGERRLRASKMAGVTTIPAIVINVCDQDSAVLAIIENLQRQNLNFLEEAEGLHNLMVDYNFTQEQMANKIGKSQSAIANKMRILKLPKSVQTMLVENDLTERHARALLALSEEADQLKILQRVIEGNLTVKKTEELIAKMLESKKTQKNKHCMKLKRFVKDIKIFTNTIKQAIDVMNDSGLKTEYDIDENETGCDILIRIDY